MPPRKSGLGRGLDALFGQPAATAATGPSGTAGATGDAVQPGGKAPGAGAATVGERREGHGVPVGSDVQYAPLMVEIGRIEPNPLQPRRQFDPQRLQDLADSIGEHGVIQPLVVTQVEPRAGDRPGLARYQLVAGERRWQAAKLAGLVRVPVVVREAAGRELLELALVENVQRADLNALEEAVAYQQLSDEFGMTQDEIGKRVGKSRFAVSNTIRLLQLPAAVQQLVLDGELSEGHARAILGLVGDREGQRMLAQHVVERALTVRQTEELVRRAQQAQPAAQRSAGGRRRDVLADEIEERFREALGTKVQLSRSKRGGRLVIHYYDDEQLMSLYDRLAGGE